MWKGGLGVRSGLDLMGDDNSEFVGLLILKQILLLACLGQRGCRPRACRCVPIEWNEGVGLGLFFDVGNGVSRDENWCCIGPIGGCDGATVGFNNGR